MITASIKKELVKQETEMLNSIIKFDIGALGLQCPKLELSALKEAKKNIFTFKNLSYKQIISIYETAIAAHEKPIKKSNK